jgi:transcriptional regulator with XRE-family HTH domain
MEAATIIRRARQRADLSLRALAREAETSHATIAAYESQRVNPTVDTMARVVRAAGFEVTATLTRTVDDEARRGRELRAALELAEQFPRRARRADRLPIFPKA